MHLLVSIIALIIFGVFFPRLLYVGLCFAMTFVVGPFIGAGLGLMSGVCYHGFVYGWGTKPLVHMGDFFLWWCLPGAIIGAIIGLWLMIDD